MTETTSTDGDHAQHLSQSDDDGVLSTVSGGAASRQSPPQLFPGTPSSDRSAAARLELLHSIADSDVPYANALYSTEGVVIKYVIRFVDTHGVRWCVEKRYSDILPLHDTLKEAYERTRSIGVKLSSFLSSSRGSSSVASPPRGTRTSERASNDEARAWRQRDSTGSSDANPGVSGGAAGLPSSDAGSCTHSSSLSSTPSNNNSRSALPFPKFPSKALSKATNTSIKFILRRRLELSQYFSSLLSGGIDRFVKSAEAKEALLQFVNHPALSPQTGFSSFAAASAGVAPSSESAYCFKENDDGFVSVEQKTFVYAYFTVPTNSRMCPVAEWLKTAAGTGTVSTTSARSSSVGGDDDVRVATLTTKAQHRDPHSSAVRGAAEHMPPSTATPPRGTAAAPPWASSAEATTDASGGGDGLEEAAVPQSPHPVEPTRSPPRAADGRITTAGRSAEPRQQSRKASLERNQSVNSYIPTLTISLPYARIVFDLNDSSRVIIALRCERLEGRPEIVRRRDELLAFYRHIANGSVDRLPDVHEAKRFFVNYRRDNPLQEIGTALKLPVGAEYRDRLPEDTSSSGRGTPSAASSTTPQRHHHRHGASPLEEFSDVEDNLDREEQGDDDDERNNGSIVISLASLKNSAAASGARELRRSITSERSAAALRFGALSPLGSDPARLSCSNSQHFITTTTTVAAALTSPMSASEPTPQERTRTTTVETWPVNNCRCTSEVFCYNYGNGVPPTQAADAAAADADSGMQTDGTSPNRVVAVTRVAAFQSANGFQINIHQPPSGNHKRPRKLSGVDTVVASSAPQSRQ